MGMRNLIRLRRRKSLKKNVTEIVKEKDVVAEAEVGAEIGTEGREEGVIVRKDVVIGEGNVKETGKEIKGEGMMTEIEGMMKETEEINAVEGVIKMIYLLKKQTN